MHSPFQKNPWISILGEDAVEEWLKEVPKIWERCERFTRWPKGADDKVIEAAATAIVDIRIGESKMIDVKTAGRSTGVIIPEYQLGVRKDQHDRDNAVNAYVWIYYFLEDRTAAILGWLLKSEFSMLCDFKMKGQVIGNQGRTATHDMYRVKIEELWTMESLVEMSKI